MTAALFDQKASDDRVARLLPKGTEEDLQRLVVGLLKWKFIVLTAASEKLATECRKAKRLKGRASRQRAKCTFHSRGGDECS